LIRIPTAPEYGSLNLAQAVQIVCYEILMATCASGAPPMAARATPPATAREMRAFQAHLDRVLRTSGFMHEGNAAQLGGRLERLFARALPDDGEVRILRGMLAAFERGLRPAE
jgi:tRNA C32,U32 (ribose-2'-O)-methylase TrmJ